MDNENRMKGYNSCRRKSHQALNRNSHLAKVIFIAKNKSYSLQFMRYQAELKFKGLENVANLT